jgi:flagellin-specific chaperone FliS
LSDKIISLQFEVVRYSGESKEKENLSNSLKALQALVSDVIKDLPLSDRLKAKKKIQSIREALAQFSEEWRQLKTTVTSRSSSATVDSTNSEYN